VQNQIVEYREHGKVAAAVVIVEGDPIMVLTERGRELRLPAGRVVHRTGYLIDTSDKRAAADELEKYSKAASKLAETIDPEQLWEKTCEPGGTNSLDFLAGLSFDKVGPTERSAILRALAARRDLFKQSRAGFLAKPREQVEKIRKEAQERALEETRRINFAKWLKKKSAGADDEIAPDGSEQYLDMLADFAASTLPAAASLEQDLLLRAGLEPDEATPTAAFSLLVKAGFLSEDENLLLRKYARRVEFPREVEETAKQAASTQVKGRRKIFDKSIMSIDDPETSEIDDAIQLQDRKSHGGWSVAIYIADPDYFVPRDHPVDIEATKRGATLYLPDRKIQMLPPILADNAASLVKGEERPALAFFLEITQEGEIISSRIEQVLVKVGKRLTFDQVETLLAGKDQKLNELLACADALRRRRYNNGAYLLTRPDIVPRIGPENKIRLKRYSAASASGRLVAELMIAANRTAARACEDAAVPAPFRIQPSSPSPLPQPPIDAQYDPLFLYNLLRNLERTQIKMESGPHAGLGVDSYIQVTSPLRRYTDLLGHRQLKAAISGTKPVYSAEELELLVGQSERLVSEGRIIEGWSRDYYMLKYLCTLADKTLSAVVLRWFNARLLVELEDYSFRTTVKCDRKYPPGKRLLLKIVKIEPRENRLDLEIIEQAD